MDTNLRDLGALVRAAREDVGLSQEDLALRVLPATNRTAVALLEQGRRLPPEGALRAICSFLHIPKPVWEQLLDSAVLRRLDFETVLSELVGRTVNLRQHDEHACIVAQAAVQSLFGTGKTKEQLYSAFCATLVYYGINSPSLAFVNRYLSPDSFQTTDLFRKAVQSYQCDAIRLFSSFAEAYDILSKADSLDTFVSPIAPRPIDHYRQRTEWVLIEDIPQERLADLGYISAARVRKEQAERQLVAGFLSDLASKIEKEGRTALSSYSEKRRRKIGSLLRKFDSIIQHDLLSPLFVVDADELRREARRLAPKEAEDLQRMEQTQATGQRNLSRYLAADHLDVYVATSMRSEADFVSVNTFVRNLFAHELLRPLKFRYFNPTQSWIEDRVAKGLVEALMLRRADFTVYMAQKTDTFGKDSEASVALGQGKPVIVYVPKLYIPAADIDSEKLGLADWSDLQRMVQAEASGEDADVDETTDHQALLAQVIHLRLVNQPTEVLLATVRNHWADFDLYGEATRIDDQTERADYRMWLDKVIQSGLDVEPSAAVRTQLHGVFVATATNFERRATVFREVHPLALQVVLSSGVINGILVARSIDACADLLAQLAKNNLSLELQIDTENYRLVERMTRSTVRVISRHQLVTNAFSTFYLRG